MVGQITRRKWQIKWLAAFVVLFAFATSAAAQTTTFPGSVCDSSFSVAGGVNVSIPSSGGNAVNCIANVGKGAGLRYFTYTATTPGWTAAVGLAASGLPTNGYDSGGGESIGGGFNSTGYLINQDGSPRNIGHTTSPNPPGTFTTPPITYVPGATVGIAVNFDSVPRQIWITPDITSTSGCGGGPMWNGDANSAPLVRGGCGGSGTGTYGLVDYTGLYFGPNLPPLYPAITGQNFGGQGTNVTFGFNANATLDALLAGGGYQAWSVPGGNAVVLHPTTANVANAPGWTPNHAVVAGDRVLAGPGWSGGSFVNGQPLYLWAVTGAGGTTAPSGNGPQVCPDPARYGGGFAGSTPSQWSGHTTVNDNGITWTCLTVVDYPTMHDMQWDAPPWLPNHSYYYFERAVSSAGNASLWMVSNHSSNPAICVSGTTPPVDGGSDGNCMWASDGAGSISYSSGNNRILHLVEPYQDNGGHVVRLTGTGSTVVWYGGLERQTYRTGVGGEDSPINVSWQTNTTEAGEPATLCFDGLTNLQGPGCGFHPLQYLTTAPGDSATETLGLTNGPIRPDSANGVMFMTSGAPNPNSLPIAIYGLDFNVNGIQAYDRDNVAFGGGTDVPNGSGNLWGSTVSNVLVEGGGCAAFSGGSINLQNVLVIYDPTTLCDYGTAVYTRFPRSMYNVTIQGAPGVSAVPTTIASESQKPEYPTNEGVVFAGGAVSNIQNSWLGGFANPIYYLSLPDGVTPQFGPVTGSNNATDILSSYTPIPAPVPIPWGGMGPYYGGPTWPVPGTNGIGCGGPCQGLNAADVFVSPVPPYDFRLKSGSPAIGAGAGPLVFPPLGYTSDISSVDLCSNARPTSGRYDIGVCQFAGSPPTVSITAVNLSASSFVAGTPSTVGNLTTVLSSGFFSGTDTLVTSGTDHAGAACNNYGSDFAISGTSPSYQLSTTGPVAGSYPGVCVSTDQPGASNTPYVQAFTLTGTTLPSPPVITSATTATGNVGTPFSYQITATNSPTSYGATALTDGLSLNTSTGFITGTPTSTASISSTISATNAGGTGTGPLAITISGTTMTTIVVANAPGWVASHTYGAGDRVLAGPGWTPGSPGSFTSYSPLYEWGTSTGGTAGSSQPGGFATCPLPAGYGGALVNPTVAPSQWSSATHVTDNGVTWTCLTAVDNPSEHDMNIDAPVYQNGAFYFNGQYAAFNNTIYQNVKTPLTLINFCTTNTSSPLTDTGCAWSVVGTIQYSAGINYWPHQAYSSGTAVNYVSQLTGPVTVIFYHGGLTTRPSYQPGVAGESVSPMTISNHYDYTGSDTQPDGTDYPFILTAAPGDSFRDNLTVGTGPLRFDPTKGVNFFANGPWSGSDRGVPFAPSDSGGSIIGIQIQSVNGAAIEGQFSVNNVNSGHSNNITLADDIIDAGGTTSGPDRGISPDGGWILHDNTITCRSPFVGGVCVESKYITLLYNNTIIGPGTSNATADSQLNTAFGIPEFYNNNLFGFAHTFAWALTAQTSPVGGAATNAIDSATNTSGTSFTGPATSGVSGDPGDTFVTAVIPLDATCGSGNTSTCAGLSANNQFINPTPGGALDLRLKTSPLADVAGAGAPFSSSVFGISGPGSDILGQSRASRIDFGAINAAGAAPATASGGFRRLDRW